MSGTVGCGTPSRARGRPAGQPPSKLEPSRPEIAHVSGPARWSIVYRRRCSGSITDPVVSPSGAVVVYCDAFFDSVKGSYRGRASVGIGALLADDRAVAVDFTTGGVALVPVASGASTMRSRGGHVEAMAVSQQRSHVVAIEQASPGDERGEILVRELPTLRVVRRAPIATVGDRPEAGFLSDGREVAHIGSQLLTVEAGRAVPLAPALSGLRAIALAGDLAAVIGGDGVARVVSLPTGGPIAELEAVPGNGGVLAMTADGSRVAVGGPSGVAIYARTASGYRLEDRAELRAHSLRFAPDGTTLYVDASSTMVALRRGADLAPLPPPRYEPKVPAQFAQAALEDGVLVLDGGDRSRGEPGLVGWYSLRKGGTIDVLVYVHEASEIDAAHDDDAWARLVVRRFERRDDVPRYRVWRDGRGQRSMTIMTERREGCDPHDAYVRYTEEGGLLYRVVVEVPPGASNRVVEPVTRAFLTEPFGESTPALVFERPRRRYLPGPC